MHRMTTVKTQEPVSERKYFFLTVSPVKNITRYLRSRVKGLSYSNPKRFSTATTLIYANGAGITTAAGTRLIL